MKKHFLVILLTATMLMSGCSFSKILYPSIPKAELYYNTVDFITKADVKNGMYDDLFLNQYITSDSSQEYVLKSDGRQISGQVLNYVDYIPKATEENALCSWLSKAVCQYGFSGPNEVDNRFVYYLVQRLEGNTYDDYLNVMRALTLKYGECTTEVYKKEGFSINNTSISEDVTNTQELIKKYNEAFSNGEITVESRWVTNLYTITVAFAEDGSARITYEFAK